MEVSAVETGDREGEDELEEADDQAQDRADIDVVAGTDALHGFVFEHGGCLRL